MPRGQQKHWQLLQKVPKGPTSTPVPIDRCIKYDRPSERSRGRFHVYRYQDGTQKCLGSFATLDEAIRCRDGETDLEPITQQRMKLNAYFDSFYIEVVTPARKASTIRSMNARYNSGIRASLGERVLQDIEVADVTWFAAKVLRRDCSAQTQRETLSLLKAIFAHAVANRIIRTNPAAHVKLPPRDAHTVQPPAFATAQAIVAAIAYPIARMAAETMLYTGMRVGECLALTWEHVDLTARTITVRQSIDHCSGDIGTPKTKRSLRSIPIPARLLASLQSFRASQQSGAIPQRDAWLFPSDDTCTRPTLSYEHFTKRYWNPACDAAGTVGITLHQLRHLYASRLIQTGTPITTAADLLGHYSSSFTVAVYGHCLDSKKELVARVDHAFEEPRPTRKRHSKLV